jgi:hypothetical protein
MLGSQEKKVSLLKHKVELSYLPVRDGEILWYNRNEVPSGGEEYIDASEYKKAWAKIVGDKSTNLPIIWSKPSVLK